MFFIEKHRKSQTDKVPEIEQTSGDKYFSIILKLGCVLTIGLCVAIWFAGVILLLQSYVSR